MASSSLSFLSFRRAFPLVLLAVWLAGGGVMAKPVTVPFTSEYQVENWDLDEGFPENSCSGIVTAPDGYMWIATFRGLVRFNGQTFRTWGPAAFPALASTGIISMHRDLRGRVWLSTLDGLYLNDGATWRHWLAQDGWINPLDHVRSYAENARGDLVLTRHSGRVFRFEGGRFRELPLPPGTGGTLAGMDAEGGLYYFRSGRAGWFVEGGWREIPGLSSPAVGALQSREGEALIVCRDELLRLRGGQIVRRVPLSESVSSFWQGAEQPDGTLWLAAVNSGMYRISPDGTVKHFRRKEGLPFDGGTRAVYIGNHGEIWIGSGVGGLTRFRPARFRFLGADEGLPDGELLTLTELSDGRLLFAPYGLGLYAFGEGSVTPFKTGVNTPIFCRSILRTRDGSLWVGAYGAGLYRIADQTSERLAGEFMPRDRTESVHSLFEDSAGRLWVGGEQRVLRYDGRTFSAVPLPGTGTRRPTIFAESRDGSIYIGQHERVFRVRAHELSPVPVAQLSRGVRISSMLVDGQDRLWVATAMHGLHLLTEKGLEPLTPEQGLPSPAVGALVRDDGGMLWFGAGRNIVRADPADLALAIKDRDHRPHLLLFGREDGLRSLDFTYGTQPNVLKDSGGRLWFAMIRGVAMVDPRAIHVQAQPPPVVVESVSYIPADEREPVTVTVGAEAAPLVLPAGSRMIKLNYAALDFAAPKKQRFMVALDGEWQDMHDQGTAAFLELLPGRHTFEVQARGSDGVWNRTGARLNFEIERFYWQTGWFRIAAASTLLGLVASGIWLVTDRRTRIARENLARERTLAEARTRLALVLENTSDFVAFFNDGGQLTFLNRAGRTLIGVAPAAGIGQIAVSSLFPAWAELIHRDQALPTAFRQGSWSGELALAKADGEVPVSVLLIAHRDPAGALQFVSMIARDISAAKRYAQVQDALRNLATALTAALSPATLGRAVAESCRLLFRHDAFFLARVIEDRTLEIRICHAEDIFSANEAVHPPVKDIAERIPQELASVIAGAPLRCSVGPEQGAAPCQIGAEPMRSALYVPVRYSGRTIGVLAVQSSAAGRYGAVDLEQLEMVAHHCAGAMARLNAEEQLRQNEERLRQSQKLEAVGTLAGGIAHDFNNILTAILGYLELSRSEVAPPVRSYLDKIEQSTMRARDLVRRILAFSRPQESRQRMADVTAVAAETLKLMRSTVPAIVDFELRALPQLPPASIDPTELHQVLLNLGTNAVHALGATAGRVSYSIAPFALAPGDPAPASTLKPGEYVRIRVEDTGAGIPREILPRIFDPFFTTKPVGQGTGLGLSVAHGIVHSCGGAIAVASEVGVGTTFAVYLPVSRERPAPAAEAEAAPAAPAASAPRRRLAIVDDESSITMTFSVIFRRAGYEVATFGNPGDALDAFKHDPSAFDVLLTDLSMPGMTGIHLAQACHELRPDLPIVLMSGYVRDIDRDAVRAAGILEIVEKPVSIETVLRVVGNVVHRSAAADAPLPGA